MSWSLQLRNGDLALNGVQLGTVSGSNKLIQDLRCALLEPMGTDDMHPSYGSLIDGGRRPDGTQAPSMLGSMNWNSVALQIRAEIRRIATEHRNRQLARARTDQNTYGKPTLDSGELLINITNITMQQVQDTMIVHVELEVGDGTNRVLNIPISSQSVITT